MPSESITRPSWPNVTLFLLTGGAVLLCAFILSPLFSAIVGAIVLAVITQHPYDWLATKIRNRNACATVALFLIVLSLILPCFFLAQEIVQQALDTVHAIRQDTSHHAFFAFLARHPTLTARVESVTDAIDLDDTLKASAAFLGRHLFLILGHSIVTITQLVFMLFILFFLLRDRALFLEFMHRRLPLREEETSVLLERVDNTIKATALGRLSIAALQGILAGLGYWVLGVPGVVLWAFTTGVFAMIPGVGAILVWSPIALYLGLNGHWGKAALLAIWGGGIVSLIDNILYPIFVGTRLRTHTVAILLSILGGIALFGVTGIIIGPVAFTVADTLLDLWKARTALSNKSEG